MTRAHALLSASSAARWLHCTAAPRLEAQFPDTTSEFAKEGTLAHSIAELKLRKYAIEPMSQRAYSRRLNALKKDELYQSEMEGFTDSYIDYIKKIVLAYPTKPFVTAEKRVDFSTIVPGGFGTADCVILHGEDMHIIDFKYGKGVPIDAHDNPQMRLYAIGALQAYGLLYAPKIIHMHIVQPRISNFSEETIALDDLIEWGKQIADTARDAYNGPGKFAPGENTCRFCRAKGQCKARADYFAAMNKTMEAHKDPKLITMAELGEYLKKAKALEAWAKDLQEYALSCCLSGKEVPGWKAVEGRGTRTFTDQDAAYKELIEHGIAEAILYERVPLTLAKAEKAIGKTEFNELVGKYIVKNPGRPTLVPESDKREAIDLQPKASDLFTDLTVDKGDN